MAKGGNFLAKKGKSWPFLLKKASKWGIRKYIFLIEKFKINENKSAKKSRRGVWKHPPFETPGGKLLWGGRAAKALGETRRGVFSQKLGIFI